MCRLPISFLAAVAAGCAGMAEDTATRALPAEDGAGKVDDGSEGCDGDRGCARGEVCVRGRCVQYDDGEPGGAGEAPDPPTEPVR